jgi:hypothetical protein
MNRVALLFSLVFFVLSSYAGIDPQSLNGDSINVDALRSKATELQSKANELKSKATELKNVFEGYQSKAKTKGKKGTEALKEASDGLDMADKAVKDCEEVEKLGTKVIKAKKPEEVKKYVEQMDKKVKNAKYFIRQADDRKKEAEFELKGW